MHVRVNVCKYVCNRWQCAGPLLAMRRRSCCLECYASTHLVCAAGTVGALVGPPWSKRQLGVVFREMVSDSPLKKATSLYFESHCDFDESSVRSVGQVGTQHTHIHTHIHTHHMI